MVNLDVYWSFRSPYCHLAIGKIIEISTLYNLNTKIKFVRPLAIRKEKMRRERPIQQVPYIILDIQRQGEFLDVPISLPKPDPVMKEESSKSILENQSRLMNLLGLGLAACEFDRGLEYASNVSNLIWGLENWNLGDHLDKAAQDAGLKVNELEDWVKDNKDNILEIVKQNEKDMQKHHWGVPLMVINDEEPFFGQDRLDVLIFRLEQMGLKKQ